MTDIFIQWAKDKLGDVSSIEKETHGDQSDVYKLQTPRGTFFLKIGKKLFKEQDKLSWLEGKLPVPKVIGLKVVGDTEALLMTSIEGSNLARMKKQWVPEKVVRELVLALHMFHNTDVSGCPFGDRSPQNVLVHGDACLPNFIYKDGSFSGFIDVGDTRIGNKEIDLSAAVWSLQYNLGKGYGKAFLEQYGVTDPTDEYVEELRLKYEDMQKDWFPDETKISL